MTEQRPTEPLRAEHRGLLPHPLALDDAAALFARMGKVAHP